MFRYIFMVQCSIQTLKPEQNRPGGEWLQDIAKYLYEIGQFELPLTFLLLAGMLTEVNFIHTDPR